MKKKIKKKLILNALFLLFYFIIIKHYYKDIVEYPKFIIEEYYNLFVLLNANNNFNIFQGKNQIEIIFILISIFPFLKKEIIITKKNPAYELMKYIFNINNNEMIKINKNNKTYFSARFKKILYYNWEFLPNRNKSNYIRHILYHLYPRKCLHIYERSLNLNIKYYIFYNKKKLSFQLISDLMSKK